MSRKRENISRVSSFILKLISILDDQQSNGLIEWVGCNAFMIHDLNLFSKVVLKKYYNHENIASFIRQLNAYGFSKVKSTEEGNFYMHDNFIKNNRKKLRLIKRKSHNKTNVSERHRQEKEKAENKELHQSCRRLVKQNQQYKQINSKIQKQLKVLAELIENQFKELRSIFESSSSSVDTCASTEISKINEFVQQSRANFCNELPPIIIEQELVKLMQIINGYSESPQGEPFGNKSQAAQMQAQENEGLKNMSERLEMPRGFLQKRADNYNQAFLQSEREEENLSHHLDELMY